MNYIEMLIAWSPDHGDGSFELAVSIAIVSLVIGLFLATQCRSNERISPKH